MPLTPTIDLSPPGGAPINLEPRLNSKASPKEAAQAFESLFASMLIKHMRQPLQSGQGLFGNDPSDVLGGLFDHFMGQHIAQNGGLGVGAMIEKYATTAQPSL